MIGVRPRFSWVNDRRVNHEKPRENPVQDRPKNALVRGVADHHCQGTPEAYPAASYAACRAHIVPLFVNLQPNTSAISSGSGTELPG